MYFWNSIEDIKNVENSKAEAQAQTSFVSCSTESDLPIAKEEENNCRNKIYSKKLDQEQQKLQKLIKQQEKLLKEAEQYRPETTYKIDLNGLNSSRSSIGLDSTRNTLQTTGIAHLLHLFLQNVSIY